MFVFAKASQADHCKKEAFPLSPQKIKKIIERLKGPIYRARLKEDMEFLTLLSSA